MLKGNTPVRRINGKSRATLFLLGRRRQEAERPLTQTELEAFRKEVEAMSLGELEIAYKTHHNACRYFDMRVCSPACVQEFVQLWRRLKKMKGRNMVWP